MQARILAVMESWPLQLLVMAGGRQSVVALSETVRITAGDHSVAPGQLQAGQLVELDISLHEGNDENRPVSTIHIVFP
jgi:hypothetical protein